MARLAKKVPENHEDLPGRRTHISQDIDRPAALIQAFSSLMRLFEGWFNISMDYLLGADTFDCISN